jgi:hypothetical protein
LGYEYTLPFSFVLISSKLYYSGFRRRRERRKRRRRRRRTWCPTLMERKTRLKRRGYMVTCLSDYKRGLDW